MHTTPYYDMVSRLKTELEEVIARCKFLEKEVRNTKDLERLKYENRKQYREWKVIILLWLQKWEEKMEKRTRTAYVIPPPPPPCPPGTARIEQVERDGRRAHRGEESAKGTRHGR